MALCFLASVLCARLGAQPATPPVGGAPSIDFVDLINGDRISGEIKSYKEGRLFVSAPEGDINIKWNKIVSIRSSKLFEVETTDASHLFGSLAPSDPPGRLVVAMATGPVTISFTDVVALAPLFQTFFRRIDGTFDLGFNYTNASKLLQFNVSSDATYRKPKFEFLSDLSIFYSRQNGETTSQRGNLDLTYFKFLKGWWLLGGGLGFENNRDLGLKLRSTVGLSVGRFFVQTNRTSLPVTAGILASHEVALSGDSNDNLDAFVDARYSTFTYDYPKLWFDAYVRVIPGLTDAPRMRVNANASFKREVVVKDFYLSLSFFYTYDSRPPSSGASKSDWGPILSIGWTF